VVAAVAAVVRAVVVAVAVAHVAAAAAQAGTDPYSGTTFRNYSVPDSVSRFRGARASLAVTCTLAGAPVHSGSLHQIVALPQS